MSRTASRRPKANAAPRTGGIGLALAGGGFLGAAYELGVLAALAESLEGIELHRLDAYVGVSAGANVHAAVRLARTLPPGSVVVTVLCDAGARYLTDEFWNGTPA